MADLNTRFAMEELRSLAFGSIVAGYTAIGDGFDNPAVQIILQNMTDEKLVFSMDGIVDHIVLPSNGYWDSDIAANRQGNRTARIPLGTIFYVKRLGVPTTGSVYLTVCYAR